MIKGPGRGRFELPIKAILDFVQGWIFTCIVHVLAQPEPSLDNTWTAEDTGALWSATAPGLTAWNPHWVHIARDTFYIKRLT